MKKLIPVIALALVALFSCKSNKQQAVELNNKLTAISTEIESKGSSLQTLMRQGMATKDFSAMTAPVNDAIRYLGDKEKEVAAMENVAGSEKYTAAVIDFLKIEKKIMQDGVLPFTKLNANSTQEEAMTAAGNLQKAVAEEEISLNKVKEEQRNYAKANDLVLIHN